MKYTACIYTVIFLFFSSMDAYGLWGDRDLPEPPIIKGASGYWIGKNMLINGVKTSLRIFNYHGTVEEVINFYQNYWKTRGHGKTSTISYGSEIVLGYELRGIFTSVHLTVRNRRIHGYIVVSSVPKNSFTKKEKTEFPIMSGNSVRRVVASNEFGRNTETVIMSSEQTLLSNVNFLINHFEPRGWKLYYSSNQQYGYNNTRPTKLSFRKEKKYVDISIYEVDVFSSKSIEIVIIWSPE